MIESDKFYAHWEKQGDLMKVHFRNEIYTGKDILVIQKSTTTERGPFEFSENGHPHLCIVGFAKKIIVRDDLIFIE